MSLAEELRVLAEKATFPPWDTLIPNGRSVVGSGILICDMANHPESQDVERANARLICALRNNLPAILAALEAQETWTDDRKVNRRRSLQDGRVKNYGYPIRSADRRQVAGTKDQRGAALTDENPKDRPEHAEGDLNAASHPLPDRIEALLSGLPLRMDSMIDWITHARPLLREAAKELRSAPSRFCCCEWETCSRACTPRGVQLGHKEAAMRLDELAKELRK